MPLLLFLSSVTGRCFFLWHHTHHHHHRQQSQQQLLVSIRWSVAHYWLRWYASIFTLATANLNSCLWRLAITHTHIHTLLAPSPSPRLATKSSAQSATLCLHLSQSAAEEEEGKKKAKKISANISISLEFLPFSVQFFLLLLLLLLAPVWPIRGSLRCQLRLWLHISAEQSLDTVFQQLFSFKNEVETSSPVIIYEAGSGSLNFKFGILMLVND